MDDEIHQWAKGRIVRDPAGNARARCGRMVADANLTDDPDKVTCLSCESLESREQERRAVDELTP